jgi:hypothetical protein
LQKLAYGSRNIFIDEHSHLETSILVKGCHFMTFAPIPIVLNLGAEFDSRGRVGWCDITTTSPETTRLWEALDYLVPSVADQLKPKSGFCFGVLEVFTIVLEQQDVLEKAASG